LASVFSVYLNNRSVRISLHFSTPTIHYGDLSGCDNVLGYARWADPHCPTSTTAYNKCKPEVETVPKSRRTDTLAKETDIDTNSLNIQTYNKNIAATAEII